MTIMKPHDVFDVAVKSLVDNVEFVDKLFKRLNIVFDVDVKLLIDKVEFVDKRFKFVLNANTNILVLLINSLWC